MPIVIGYQQIATATNKTDEQVREDRKQGLLDLESVESIIDYIARARGWVPASEIEARAAQVEHAPEPERIYAGTKTVRDNVKPTDDPYLARVKRERGA